jgi:predicted Fe-Mo cluster-binding NifX family protein
MNVLVSATTDDIQSAFEPRFGRCPYFVLVDTQTHAWKAYPNPGRNALGGAGTLAAQFVVEHGADAVISGRFGPNAFDVFQAAGIDAYIANQRSVMQVVDAFTNSELKLAAGASSARHRQRTRFNR